MPRERKTVDAWEILVDYGQGWESECIELNYFSMLVNRRTYRENCNYPVKVVKRRLPKAETGSEGAGSLAEAKAAVEWFSTLNKPLRLQWWKDQVERRTKSEGYNQPTLNGAEQCPSSEQVVVV